jgi:curli biogenesis system outer membrane secretion channel CsgG
MIEASNLFWKHHRIKFVKKGKVVLETELEKEMKWLNCLLVYPLIIPTLWCYGPKEYQYFHVDSMSGNNLPLNFDSAESGSHSRVAVMDFQAKNVSKNVANNVSELLRVEIIKTGMYVVVERSQMDKILVEQGFQKSGCTDVSCAVEIGKLISAKKMLIGSVMKMGSKIVISGRIVDVEKGVGEMAATRSADGEDDFIEAAKFFVGNSAGCNKIFTSITGKI